MRDRRPPLLLLLVVMGSLVLAGCEPYLSMTDQIPVQTRRASALLPESPRYVGMVDVETALRNFEELGGEDLSERLRQAGESPLRSFLDATGMDPRRDVQAAYGAFGENQTMSGVLFANLTSAQMDRYVDTAPRGRRTAYRDVPLYQFAFGEATSASPGTLSVAIVEEGMLAVGMGRSRVTRMVDRYRSTADDGLVANEDYMALVKRVGHGSTAWLAGRDVVESVLRDSTTDEQAQDDPSRVSQAGLQRALSEWTDRMLGLSKVDVSSLKEKAGKRASRLKEHLREQAVSLTLTDAGLDGEVYLTMTDNASASSVVDLAEGAVAVAKLSGEDLDERQRDLLDEIEIERNGAIVHVQFSLDRDRLRDKIAEQPQTAVVRPVDPSIRPPTSTIRRSRGINLSSTVF